MAARAPPAVPVSPIRVVNSGTCIGFLDIFRAHCTNHGFPWYPDPWYPEYPDPPAQRA